MEKRKRKKKGKKKRRGAQYGDRTRELRLSLQFFQTKTNQALAGILH